MTHRTMQSARVLAFLMLFGPVPGMAAPLFSNVVESYAEYSYDFSGTGLADLTLSVQRQDTTGNWNSLGVGSAGGGGTFRIAPSFSHSFDGSNLDLNSGFLALGSTYDDFVTQAHDGIFLDTFSLRVTVLSDGNDGVGDFSGRLVLTDNREAATVPVPATLALLGLGLAGLGFARRRRR